MLRQCAQRWLGFGRHGQHTPPALASPFQYLPSHRCLFQNQMGIRSTHAKGTDTGAARGAVDRPGGQLRIHIKRAIGEVDAWIRPDIMQARRQQAPLQGQCGFNQAGHAGRNHQMAKIGFDAANGAEASFCCVLPISAGQGFHFHRIAHGGAGTMRFNIAYARGTDLGRP